jgi:hypothetical protein
MPAPISTECAFERRSGFRCAVLRVDGVDAKNVSRWHSVAFYRRGRRVRPGRMAKSPGPRRRPLSVMLCAESDCKCAVLRRQRRSLPHRDPPRHRRQGKFWNCIQSNIDSFAGANDPGP